MSFVLSLCHFCDIHGPSILMTCFTTAQDEEVLNSNETSCQACSMPEQYVSSDRLTGKRYVSCRMPSQQSSLTSWLSHVCVRSLSCEVNPCLFSEPPNCALSLSFSIRDAQARGFHHWLSVVVSSRDLGLLAASWPFLTRNINIVISWLQDKATQVYNMERPFRNSEKPAQPRSLTQLVKSKAVYARLHCWFAWMIQACHSRLSEKLPRSPYFKLEPQHVFEEGSLKSLRVFLGPSAFDLAALYVLEGRQVIVRGDILSLVEATINTLKGLLPGNWCKAVVDSETYLEPSECGLLGVSTLVAVPTPCQDVVRVDMVQGCVTAKTTASMPSRSTLIVTGPTLVAKILKALASDLLREKALSYHLQAFHQEWAQIAKLVRLTRMENNASLMAVLGVKPQDHQLVSYWSRNFGTT